MVTHANKRHTFVLITDLYSDKGAESRCVKKGVEMEYDCNTEDVRSVSETCDKRGKIYQDRCLIYHEFDGRMVVKGSKREVSDIVFGAVEDSKIGFKNSK